MTAFPDIINDWFSNMDNGLLNGVIFLDLKKAFDTADHEILLINLTDRKQRTYGNGSLSDSGSLFVVSLKVPSWDPYYA